MSFSTTSSGSRSIIRRITSLSFISNFSEQCNPSSPTHHLPQGILQSSASSITQRLLQILDILRKNRTSACLRFPRKDKALQPYFLIRVRNFAQHVLGQVGSFILAHSLEGFLFHLPLDLGWDAEEVDVGSEEGDEDDDGRTDDFEGCHFARVERVGGSVGKY